MAYFDLIACLKCNADITPLGDNYRCSQCNQSFPIIGNVPRFVSPENYAGSFGIQWNRFEKTQIDSSIMTNRSESRFLDETLWDSDVLNGKYVLDAGCGAGRFSEIALKFGANLIAVDFSSAVDTAFKNLRSDSKLVIQADLSCLPIKSNSLDYIYCIGVLQHTKDPESIVRELVRCLKPDGELTLTFYENSSWHVKLYSKYLIRPLTKRIPSHLLLKLLIKTSAVWFPVTSWLFKLPQPFSRIFRFILPIANYVEYTYQSRGDALSEAILDTFDMLSPAYDRPIKKSTILKWIGETGVEMKQLAHRPVFGTLRFKKPRAPKVLES
ncbi:SmtA SAM-dependent methyltransferases [Candidatus Nanopelagicaceae bacterium]